MTRGMRTAIVVAIALITATVASYGIYRTVQRIPGRVIEIRQVPVVAATQALPAGTRLTQEHLKMVQWPADAPLPGAHARVEEVLDRGLVAPVLLNEPITEAKLAASEFGAGLPPTIPEGLRAISVRVNEVIGVGLFVGPGTRVDVLATFNLEEGPISRAVVENVEILAAGTPYDAERAAQQRRPVPPSVVTLAVTPEQAERIALVATNGQILLALRNPGDGGEASTPGVRLRGLLAGQVVTPRAAAPPASGPRRPPPAAPAPPPPVVPVVQAGPPRPYMVEAIRAAKRSEEEVQSTEDRTTLEEAAR